MAQRHIIHCVLFERWFLDIERLQTHHFRQFLVTFQRSPTSAFIDGITRHFDNEIDLVGLAHRAWKA